MDISAIPSSPKTLKIGDGKVVPKPQKIASAHLDGYRIIAASMADNHSLFLAKKTTADADKNKPLVAGRQRALAARTERRHLPLEIVEQIFVRCDVRTRLQMTATCKAYAAHFAVWKDVTAIHVTRAALQVGGPPLLARR